VVGVSADSLDIARGIGERDGEAFSDRRKTGVILDVFVPPGRRREFRCARRAALNAPPVALAAVGSVDYNS
jgi:hypothetical protein